MNIMAGFQGMRYSELLAQILQAAVERLGVVAKPAAAAGDAATATPWRRSRGAGSSRACRRDPTIWRMPSLRIGAQAILSWSSRLVGS